MDDRQDDVMLPEGWQTGETLFDQPPQNESTAISDESGAPTPEPNAPIGDGRDDPEQAPTPESMQTDRPNTLRFQARIDRENRDVELDERELPTIYQKAQVTDRVQARLARLMERGEALSRQMGYQSLNHMLDTAEQGLNDQPKGPSLSASPTRDYRREAQALLDARPELRGKSLPASVHKACAEGKSLLAAYADYEVASEREISQRLRRENTILRQNAEAARRAPVRASQGGSSAVGEDDFLRGFHFDD